MRNEVSVALVLAGLFAPGRGQVHHTLGPLSGVTETAFTYFQQVEGYRFDEFPAASPPNQTFTRRQGAGPEATPASGRRQRLSRPADQTARSRADNAVPRAVSAIDVKVLRVGGANAAFLAGAAILITEPALEVLSSQELQATVAHELGHHCSGVSSSSRASRGSTAKLQEIELRCNGIAVITLTTLRARSGERADERKEAQ